MSKRKKKTQSGSKKEQEKLVSSKIEHTNSTTSETSSLRAYRKSIKDMSSEIKGFALGLCNDNLLTVKMALMGAVREIEEMVRERREK